eukprot:4413646-Pyramimonas_sp.AAC.1
MYENPSIQPENSDDNKQIRDSMRNKNIKKQCAVPRAPPTEAPDGTTCSPAPCGSKDAPCIAQPR